MNLYKLLCPIVACTLLIACSKAVMSEPTTTDYPTANIGIVMSNVTNPFFKGAHDTYAAEAEQSPNLTVWIDNANDDQNTQNQQIEQLLTKGAQALIINLADIDQGQALIDKYCHQVPLIFLTRNPGDKNLASCPNAYFVDGDAAQAGILQGLQVLELWQNNPQWDKNKDGIIQYALIKGIPHHAGAMARSKWAIGTLKNYPNIGKPVQELFADHAFFQRDNAKQLVDGWVIQPNFAEVEVILANNDSMALGASDTLQAKGIQLPIFGIDATEEALQAVKAGKISATVINDYENQAKTSLRLAANLANGQEPLTGIDYIIQNGVIQLPYRRPEQ